MFLLDTNILRRLGLDYEAAQGEIIRTPWSEIALPSVVVAEALRGRAEQVLKADASDLVQAHERFRDTRRFLLHFNVVSFDVEAEFRIQQLLAIHSSKKRYADLRIAAITLAGNHILVTRNTRHFEDVLPRRRLVDWLE